MSKREYIATKIAAGIRSGKYKAIEGDPIYGNTVIWKGKDVAEQAVSDTDHLLKALEDAKY